MVYCVFGFSQPTQHQEKSARSNDVRCSKILEKEQKHALE